jgi:hypothetical protein
MWYRLSGIRIHNFSGDLYWLQTHHTSITLFKDPILVTGSITVFNSGTVTKGKSPLDIINLIRFWLSFLHPLVFSQKLLAILSFDVEYTRSRLFRQHVVHNSFLLPLGTLRYVASLLTTTLYQGNHDRKRKLWNIVWTVRYKLHVQLLLKCY